MATGGALKNILKDDDLTDEKMVNTGENDNDEKTDEKRLNFTYYKSKKGYIYNPEFNEWKGQGFAPCSTSPPLSLWVVGDVAANLLITHSPIPKMK